MVIRDLLCDERHNRGEELASMSSTLGLRGEMSVVVSICCCEGVDSERREGNE
jgi:hypothetical protein